jgi:glycosyltransferase involved in cell wall biosynthesis
MTDSAFLITYIGHWNKSKGMPELLPQVLKFLDGHAQARLLLCLSGYSDRKSPAIIHPQVLLEGKVDVAKILQASDCLLLPFKTVTGSMIYPNLLLEGLANGTVVLTRNIPPLDEVITNQKNGYLFSKAEELPAVLEQIYASQSKLKHIRHAALETAKHYRPEVVAERLVEVYDKLVPAPVGRGLG